MILDNDNNNNNSWQLVNLFTGKWPYIHKDKLIADLSWNIQTNIYVSTKN